MTGPFRREQTRRHPPDAFRVADRSAAVFLNDQTHDEARRPVFSILATVSTPALLQRANGRLPLGRELGDPSGVACARRFQLR